MKRRKKNEQFYFSGRTPGGGVNPPEPLIEEEKNQKKSYDAKQKLTTKICLLCLVLLNIDQPKNEYFLLSI